MTLSPLLICKNVCVHNLKGINIKLTPGQFIVFTGVSGSGKSSLAFDTLFIEGQRRYIESLPASAKRGLAPLAKPEASSISGISPTIAIEQKAGGRNPRSTVGTMTQIYDFLRVLFARVAEPHCPLSGERLSPLSTEKIFHQIMESFSGQRILLLASFAKGKKGEFKEELADLTKKGFLRVRIDGSIYNLADELPKLDKGVSHTVEIVVDRIVADPLEKNRLLEAIEQTLALGEGLMSVISHDTNQEVFYSQYAYSPKSKLFYPPLEPEDFSFNHPKGMCESCHGLGCDVCDFSRLKPYPSAAKLAQKKIDEITKLSVEEAFAFFSTLSLDPLETIIAEGLIKEISSRLSFLQEVGLKYLSLDRTLPSLSGGETQRVRLASHLGSSLVGATYILDEPSIGLHQRDNQKLLLTLKRLQKLGNTLIVVEHDEETIASADYVVDIGPKAGILGGEVVAEGTIEDICKSPNSLTGAYLSGREKIPIPKKRRKPSDQKIVLKGASHNNLKNVNLSLPLGLFIAITGVSGSGKSSLIDDTLYPLLSNKLNKTDLFVGKHKTIQGAELLGKVIGIDQTPIGRTPRSNPATYIKVFDNIRDLFASLPEAKAKGYTSGRFSFNVKEGSCASCSGMGMQKVDMDFLADEWVVCESCQGQRFDEKTLAVTYRMKNIHEILEMSVREAHDFFEQIPEIQRKLHFLLQVGLDYIKLGQSSTTLSGGEAQRIKLAKELIRPPKQHTLYILDEPTTGLHFHDIRLLTEILQNLVNIGHTVVVIEHNLDLIKTVDWIIDLGPEGGPSGGEIIAEGTPEQIAKLPTPTGIYLNKSFQPQNYSSSPLSVDLSHQSMIKILGAKQNTLKNLFVDIPLYQISLFAGPSGSGKTSLAFDTLYAEGQRRYTESLSTYAKQLVKPMPKPKVDDIKGLMAAIAVEQKKQAGNPRSTVGTISEIYDYLRIVYARLGTAFAPETGHKLEKIDPSYVTDALLELPEKMKIQILAPLKGKSLDEVPEGYLRIRLNGVYYELDQEIPFNPKAKNILFVVIDRIVINKNDRKRLHDAVETASKISNGIVVIAKEDQDISFNLKFADPSTGTCYPSITYQTFSFNTEEGMCPECFGLGFRYGCHLRDDPAIGKLSCYELFVYLIKDHFTRESEKWFLTALRLQKIDPSIPIEDLSKQDKDWFFQGTKHGWKGIDHVFALLAKYASGDMRFYISPFLSKAECTSCLGTRLHPLARSVLVKETSITQASQMPLEKLKAFVEEIKQETLHKTKGLEEVFDEMIDRLEWICDLGLSYLSLHRSAPTLSGGEIARLRLAASLSSKMTGALYVLDEPSAGLHPEDHHLLAKALIKLKERGNTLVVVDHNPLTAEIADTIFEFGPQGGYLGGEIIAHGSLEELKNRKESLTGLYRSGKKLPYLPKKRRVCSEYLSIRNQSKHNIKNLDIDIPLHSLIAVTGVSGAGKSTLVHGILEESLKQNQIRCISLDQSPVGGTIRSDISTYVDLLTPLRQFFASLPEAKIRGLTPAHFSFNHRYGMCKRCWGMGTLSIDLQFLPSVKTACPSCKGYKLGPLSLEVKYKGKHLGQLFSLTIQEIKEMLPPISKLIKIIDILSSFGLEYLQLGRETVSLSGGEASRLRLAKELIKPAKEHTFYLFDEPSSGLHDIDIDRLLPIFHKIVDQGHTVLFIEHNLTMIANADYIIDMGPGAGENGGKIVGKGTVQEIMELSTSTGKFLKKYFSML